MGVHSTCALSIDSYRGLQSFTSDIIQRRISDVYEGSYRIPTKTSDVILNPVQSQALVSERQIHGSLSVREGEDVESILNIDDNDGFPKPDRVANKSGGIFVHRGQITWPSK